MRYLSLVFLLCTIIFACKSKNPMITSKMELIQELKENTDFVMVTTESGFYPEFKTAAGTVIVLSYQEKGPEGTADGDYRESIYLNLPADWQRLSNETLKKKTALIFEKQCFCRGEAGYYIPENLVLSLKEVKSGLRIVASFTITGTTHKISTIDQNITLL